MNRSSEEFEMRAEIDLWGRKLWPGARVVHELVVDNSRRLDMAFIGTDYLIGVEIKSSRDKLDRLNDQLDCFSRCIPLTILAVAPKWRPSVNMRRNVDVFEVEPGADVPVRGHSYYRPDRSITTPLLKLLWAQELRNICQRKMILYGKKTAPMHATIPALARALTGDEIVREACRELRARDAFPKDTAHPPSDAPIRKPLQFGLAGEER